MRSSGTLLCLASGAAFGAMAIFGKLAYGEGATVGTLLAVRFALAAALFWALVLAPRGGARELRALRRAATSPPASRSARAATRCRPAATSPRWSASTRRCCRCCSTRSRRSSPPPRSRSAASGSTAAARRALALASGGSCSSWPAPGAGALEPRRRRARPRARRVVYSAYILVSDGRRGARGAARAVGARLHRARRSRSTAGSALLGELRPGALTAAGWGWLAVPRASSRRSPRSACSSPACGASARRRASILATVEPLVTVLLAFLGVRRDARRPCSSPAARSCSPPCSCSRRAAAGRSAMIVGPRAPPNPRPEGRPHERPQTARRQGRARRRGDPRRRTRHRRRARRGGRDRLRAPGARTRERRSEVDRPETIEETAELVDAAGGTGIAVAGRPPRPRRRSRPWSPRIDAEQGRLDVLVNDIWGAEHLFEWDTPVWEHDLDNGLRLLRLAVDTHLDHEPPRAAAAAPRAGRARRRGDRRHRRVQRRPLPRLALLRPRQGLGDADGLGASARSSAPHGAHRGRAHAGLAALGGDARALRRHRGQLARRDRALAALLHLGDPALRRPRRRRARRRSRRRALERPVAVERRARAGLRLHRPRRHAPGLLALHRRGAGRGAQADDTGYR